MLTLSVFLIVVLQSAWSSDVNGRKDQLMKNKVRKVKVDIANFYVVLHKIYEEA